MIRHPPRVDDLALEIIKTKRASTAGLATALGVSWRTAARAVQRLRKRGVRIVSVREGKATYYQHRNGAAVHRKRSFLSYAGFIHLNLRDGAANIDHYLYGWPKKRSPRR